MHHFIVGTNANRCACIVEWQVRQIVACELSLGGQCVISMIFQLNVQVFWVVLKDTSLRTLTFNVTSVFYSYAVRTFLPSCMILGLRKVGILIYKFRFPCECQNMRRKRPYLCTVLTLLLCWRFDFFIAPRDYRLMYATPWSCVFDKKGLDKTTG